MSEPRESREELEQRIAAYIDGELPPAEAARLEVFLANTDPQLAQQVIGMLADKHRLRALPPVKAPIDLAARIMEQVERASLLHDSEHFSSPKRPWYQSRAALAAGILLVIGGFSYFLITSVLSPGSPWRNPIAKTDTTPPIVAEAPAPTATPAVPSAAATPAAPPDTAIALAPAAPAPAPAMMEKGGGGGAGPNGGRFGGESSMKSPDIAKGRPIGKSAAAFPTADGNLAAPNASPEINPVQVASKSGSTPNRALLDNNAATSDDFVQLNISRDRELLADTTTTNALKLGYTETDTPQKALAEVTAPSPAPAQQQEKNTDQPIVLAFVAHKPDDDARLQSRLAGLVAADADALKQQDSLQSRVRNSPQNSVSNSINSAGSNGAPYRFYNKDAKAFDKDLLDNAPVVNNDENQAVPLQQQQQPMPQQAIPTPQLTPYRVLLRPDQLQTLASEFDLRAVSRGQSAYAITPAAAQSLANAAPQATDIQSSTPATAPTHQAPAHQAAATQAAPNKKLAAQPYIDCVITIEPAK